MFDSSETVIGNKNTFLPVGKGHTIFLQFPIGQGEALAHYGSTLVPLENLIMMYLSLSFVLILKTYTSATCEN